MFEITTADGASHPADLHELITTSTMDPVEQFALLCDVVQKVVESSANPTGLADLIKTAVVRVASAPAIQETVSFVAAAAQTLAQSTPL